MTLWHYTTGETLRLIVECGEIRPTSVRIDPGERPGVWFSTQQFWEPTAAKRLMGSDGTDRGATLEEMHEFGGGVVRIGVADAVAPIGWREFCRVSGVSAKTAQALVKAGQKSGASQYDWRWSPDPVPRARWETVERMTFPERRWERLTDADIDAL